MVIFIAYLIVAGALITTPGFLISYFIYDIHFGISIILGFLFGNFLLQTLELLGGCGFSITKLYHRLIPKAPKTKVKVQHVEFENSKLQFDESSLRIETNNGKFWDINWHSILEVFAYKDDVFGCDIICVGFRLDDAGRYVWVDEEFEGYSDLVAFLPTVFHGIRTEWFCDVAFPAFKTCLTSLWGNPKMEEIWKAQ